MVEAAIAAAWRLVIGSRARRCAGCQLVHPHLEDALDDLLARNRQLVVGRNYTSRSRISSPRQRRHRPADTPVQRGRQRRTILQQELLLALEGLARQRPALLQGTLTFQLGQLLLLLTSELAASASSVSRSL